LMLLPTGLNLDRDIPLSTSLFSPWTTLPAWIALIALVGALLWFAWRRQPAAVWALGFFVLIAPSSSIVPQADLMFEHRTYLPMVCLAIAAGFLMEHIPRPKLQVAFALLIPAMLVGTIWRNTEWHDEKSFWTDIVEKSPNKARAYLGLARAYQSDDPVRNREALEHGLQIDPSMPELQDNYGIALMAANQPAEALKHFERAMELTHPSADHFNNIGAAYFNMNEFDKSRDSYRRALELDACSYNARRNLVMLLARTDPEAAYQAGEVPASCHLVPTQAAELEQFRRQVRKKL